MIAPGKAAASTDRPIFFRMIIARDVLSWRRVLPDARLDLAVRLGKVSLLGVCHPHSLPVSDVLRHRSSSLGTGLLSRMKARRRRMPFVSAGTIRATTYLASMTKQLIRCDKVRLAARAPGF